MRTFHIAVLAFLLSGLAVPSSHADPIAVTSGVAFVSGGATGSGSISLTGTGGFSLTGELGSSGLVDAKSCLPCTPGSPLSPGAYFSGLDLFISSVTVNGVTYGHDQVNGLNSPGGITIQFSGSPLFAPETNVDGVALTGPFTMTGSFSLAPDLQTTPDQGTFFGSGQVFITLFRTEANLWQYGGIQYNFANSAVTPEPASLLLFGSGLVMAAGAIRRRAARGRNVRKT